VWFLGRNFLTWGHTKRAVSTINQMGNFWSFIYLNATGRKTS